MSSFDMVIHGGEIATSAERYQADIGIKDGCIVAIARALQGGERRIDARFR